MTRSNPHTGMVVIVVAAYALLVFPLPLTMLSHGLAMAQGDAAHSDHDEHAWLDDVVSSALQSDGVVLLSGTAVVTQLLEPPAPVFSTTPNADVIRGPPPRTS
ncbi:MAG: hypothetical protein AB1451_06440 [Nitrospirota bacterium]